MSSFAILPSSSLSLSNAFHQHSGLRFGFCNPRSRSVFPGLRFSRRTSLICNCCSKRTGDSGSGEKISLIFEISLLLLAHLESDLRFNRVVESNKWDFVGFLMFSVEDKVKSLYINHNLYNVDCK